MSSQPVKPRHHLYCFVTLKHHQQKRKYTNEPYFNHVKAVAEMADGLCKFGYEIGLCHDLLEDTDCDGIELQQALKRFGYDYPDNEFIFKTVMELTDMYIPENFPQLNRSKRKSLEAERLGKTSYEAQTVKYCDLMHNTASIVKHDKGFAKIYLAEKATILKHMNAGNEITYKKCKRVLKSALKKLQVSYPV